MNPSADEFILGSELVYKDNTVVIPFPIFQRCVDFLVTEAEIACDPVISLAAVNALKQGVGSRSSALVQIDSDKSLMCLYCEASNHALVSCFRFKKLSIPLSSLSDYVLAVSRCIGSVCLFVFVTSQYNLVKAEF